MRIIYVNRDEQDARRFQKEAESLVEVEEVQIFFDEKAAVNYLLSNRADVAFFDISDAEINGILLAGRIRKIQPNLPIVFVSKYASYAMQAFEADADGYLLKPYSRTDLERQLKKVEKRYHIRSEPAVYFRTMPRFDLFVDGELVLITQKKVKELLALLVDFAGNSLTSEQAITYLWEDRPIDNHSKALLRVTAMRLRELLQQKKIDFILKEENGVRAIETSRVICDSYQMLAGIPEVIERYHGEYMVEYSWAEVGNARLSRIAEERKKEIIKQQLTR
ncbi:MAG: response regulator [Lachnospiraceae bacterium]|nr:response regulator [Lachnospiraceae bacterium]